MEKEYSPVTWGLSLIGHGNKEYAPRPVESKVVPTFKAQGPEGNLAEIVQGSPSSSQKSEGEDLDSCSNSAPPDSQVNLGYSQKQKRNRKPDPKSWAKNVSKVKRMTGEEYSGFAFTPGEGKQKVVRPGKSLGEPCSNPKHNGTEDVSYRCISIPANVRQKIFNEFWKMDWGQKKLYVRLMIRTEEAKRKTKGVATRRTDTNIYYLRLSLSTSVRVCKGMFISTLGLKEGQVKSWLRPADEIKPRNLRKGPSEKDTFLREYFTSLPKMKKNCRSQSTKLYLEPTIPSKLQLYNLYKEHCFQHSNTPVSRTKFVGVFDEMNLSLLQPKK